ncbi:sugar-binding transcriptional regulator [Nocardioides marmoriginsengisoli]|nr:sugar-binding domain-containing protein [Nocardioides marmoriginsengisoli]
MSDDPTPLPAPAAADPMAAHVARLFYVEQLTKQEIAAATGLSRFKVARLLEHARAAGIVSIEIRSDALIDHRLSQALERRFGLEHALVADGYEEAGATSRDAATRDAVTRVAAAWLPQLLHKDDVLGVAWGSTIAGIAAHLPAQTGARIPVVQLCGAFANMQRGQGPIELTIGIAQSLGGRAHTLPLPAVLGELPLRREMLRHPAVAETIQRFGDVTTALVSIGSMEDKDRSALIGSGGLEPAEFERLRMNGVVGDLLLHPFDGTGHFIRTPLSDRTVVIAIEQLRQARVIAVAGGAHKRRAITAALRTGVIDVLVTDRETAEFVLAEG